MPLCTAARNTDVNLFSSLRWTGKSNTLPIRFQGDELRCLTRKRREKERKGFPLAFPPLSFIELFTRTVQALFFTFVIACAMELFYFFNFVDVNWSELSRNTF